MAKGPQPRGVRHARRMSLYLVRSKRHAKRAPCTLLARQRLETTVPALRLLAPVCIFLWGNSPWAGLSQAERVISMRNAMRAVVPVAGVQ